MVALEPTIELADHRMAERIPSNQPFEHKPCKPRAIVGSERSALRPYLALRRYLLKGLLKGATRCFAFSAQSEPLSTQSLA